MSSLLLEEAQLELYYHIPPALIKTPKFALFSRTTAIYFPIEFIVQCKLRIVYLRYFALTFLLDFKQFNRELREQTHIVS
jgi:hypothetical protein